MNVEEKVRLCKELRKETGLGMITCKKILIENNWSIESAKTYCKTDKVKERFCKKYI